MIKISDIVIAALISLLILGVGTVMLTEDKPQVCLSDTKAEAVAYQPLPAPFEDWTAPKAPPTPSEIFNN